jgi:hypothetical protein
MIPSLFSVFLDYVCNYSCQHCSVGSTPQTKLKMTDEVFERLFDGLKEVKNVRCVVFTGGEATLHPEMLLEGIRRSKALGLRTRVVSNAWWAKTPDAAVTFLKPYLDAGLDELNTSWDDYRLPFTTFDKIINAALAAREMKLPMGIGVIREPGAQWDEHRVKTELAQGLGVSEGELGRHVAVVSDYPTPSGSGEALDVTGCDAGERLNLGCQEVVKTISIHPRGAVKACCGHVMFYSKDLELGNLLKEPLPAIINRAQHNILYWLIHMAGPKRLLERLGIEGTYASICHACQVLLTQHREELLAYIRENPNEVFKNEVLLSDNTKNLLLYASNNIDRVVRKLEVVAEV